MNKLIIGTAQFGMPYGIASRNGQVHGDEIIAILDLAWRNGINTLDTAKTYGSSEKSIGNYLKQRQRCSWNIITKLWIFIMVNQVNSGNQQPSALANAKQQKVDLQRDNANTQAAQSATPKAASDSVSLTPQAQQLKTLQEKAQQSSGFDSNKVAELKKAITEGKYQIDSEKLAKNLADFEFDVYG